jgi:hypothetical protein
MSEADSLTPSQTLREMRAMSRAKLVELGDSAAELTTMTTRISEVVTEALTGARWTHVGWAMFALGVQLQLNAEAWVARTKSTIPRAELVKGMRAGAEFGYRAGEALISRGEQIAPAGDGGFSVDERLDQTRRRLVDGARSVLGSMLPGAESTDSLITVIRGTDGGPDDKSVLATISRALPGIDREQAGWGLLISGSALLEVADEAAPEPPPERRRGLRRKPKEGADLLGIGMVGAVFSLAGDALAPSDK